MSTTIDVLGTRDKGIRISLRRQAGGADDTENTSVADGALRARQHIVNADGPLTRVGTPTHEGETVIADDSRVIVVRAWRDSDRLIIRVLAGAQHPASREWVFADIDTACRQVAAILHELCPERADTKH
ncbi:hypothetical protein [Nocardia sp. NPDC060259]|uniref:hypothetical protein n=1 Tax=Nocardia sp. NPDC060259 TaxID=3347088 RepID=UPI003651A24D